MREEVKYCSITAWPARDNIWYFENPAGRMLHAYIDPIYRKRMISDFEQDPVKLLAGKAQEVWFGGIHTGITYLHKFDGRASIITDGFRLNGNELTFTVQTGYPNNRKDIHWNDFFNILILHIRKHRK